MQPRQAQLTAGGPVLVGTVPAVVLLVTQLLGLHTGLVPAVVLPQGAASLGVWGGGGPAHHPRPKTLGAGAAGAEAQALPS